MDSVHDHTHDHDHSHDHPDTAQLAVRTFLLLGLALYFAWNIASGTLTNYINVRFAWLAYVAVAIFAALGLVGAWALWKALTHRHDHDHTHDHEGHDHAHGSWGVLAVLCLPLVLGVLIPSQPLGAAAVNGNISTSAAAASGAPQAFTSDPATWNVLDWLRAFNRTADLATFNGKNADLIGFVYREPSFPENVFMVARFTISCCVADASAIGLPVLWADEGALGEGAWVRVQGVFQMGDFRGEQLPILRGVSVETVGQPDHPYLYP